MAQASSVYIAASVNRFRGAAHSSTAKESLVAFGSFKYVALWDVSDVLDRGVLQTLAGHDGLVTCVCFLNGRSDTVVSADDKGVIRCWSCDNSQWGTFLRFQAHTKSISTLTIFRDYIISGSSDMTVKIWRLLPEKNCIEEVQKFDLRNRFPLDVQMAEFPGTSCIILAIASTDSYIGIWLKSQDKFTKATSLIGHEDWVKCLSFQISNPGSKSLCLASGSQDGTIRLWSIALLVKDSQSPFENETDQLLDRLETSINNNVEIEEVGQPISLTHRFVTVKTGIEPLQQLSISLDALLVGHEAGITSIAWRTAQQGSISDPALMSTSTDSSVILWAQMPTSSSSRSASLWINKQRFGDVGGQRLGGFIGGLWTHNGSEVLAWGWNGGWRRWCCRTTANTNSLAEEAWIEIGGLSGHSSPVRSIDWAPDGVYLISTSADQSTRIHGKTSDKYCYAESWHELSRPQIHGYDMVNAKFLSASRFISIADEKVVRVFEAPRTFINLMRALKIFNWKDDETPRPIAASVPPLGLSNKASNEESLHYSSSADEIGIRRPFEGELSSSTLWPEIEKIFGHGNELISLAVSSSGKYVATACKATTAEDAVIRVYETQSWRTYGSPLQGHTLSVTRIAFSSGDRFVLSVSRDRSWRVFAACNDGFQSYATDKSHSRIIWDCVWAGDNDVFATASRDKMVKIWKRTDDEGKSWNAINTIKTNEAATAVAFSPSSHHKLAILAIGLENGEINIFSGSIAVTSQWMQVFMFDSNLAHCGQVNCLAWNPSTLGEDGRYQLSSGSEDGTVKIFDMRFERQANT